MRTVRAHAAYRSAIASYPAATICFGSVGRASGTFPSLKPCDGGTQTIRHGSRGTLHLIVVHVHRRAVEPGVRFTLLPHLVDEGDTRRADRGAPDADFHDIIEDERPVIVRLHMDGGDI